MTEAASVTQLSRSKIKNDTMIARTDNPQSRSSPVVKCLFFAMFFLLINKKSVRGHICNDLMMCQRTPIGISTRWQCRYYSIKK